MIIVVQRFATNDANISVHARTIVVRVKEKRLVKPTVIKRVNPLKTEVLREM